MTPGPNMPDVTSGSSPPRITGTCFGRIRNKFSPEMSEEAELRLFESMRGKLKGSTKSTEFDAVLPDLEQAFTETETELQRLQAKRETVIFEDEDLKELEADIARVNS
jgi:hypothetical protein